jgi:DNA-binding NtrC family response regulator
VEAARRAGHPSGSLHPFQALTAGDHCMIRIGIVEDELGDMVDVIRNLMALDRSVYPFEMVPALLSDLETDTPEAIEDYVEEYGKRKLRERGVPVDDWPPIRQMGPLCPADEGDRTEILNYLSAQKVNVIISDCWVGRNSSSRTTFSDAALKLAGVMLLDSASKDAVWKANNWRCWMMTKYQRDVVDKLYEVGGWRAESFDPYKGYIDKSQIKKTTSGRCDPQLERVVKEAIAEERFTRPTELPEEVAREGRFHDLVGRSEAMLRVYKRILDVAETDVDVLILGENGTGKNLAAKAIHEYSLRKAGPFVSINVTAVPDTMFESAMFGHAKGAFTDAKADHVGHFEQADGGTLFLNEIGDMPLSNQAKVLDVLEEKRVTRLGARKAVNVDVRIITGTNRPLPEMMADETFRKDLYYRISTIDIVMPALRERVEDIPLLCEHFIGQFSSKYGKRVKSVTPGALELLSAHAWPGNVRELRGLIQKSILVAGSSEVLDADNEAIAVLAKGMPSDKGVTARPPAGDGRAAGDPDYSNMPAGLVWEQIRGGSVVKKLSEWSREIGLHKTLELVDLIMQDNGGRYPTREQIRNYFNMNYNAWKTWISRNSR